MRIGALVCEHTCCGVLHVVHYPPIFRPRVNKIYLGCIYLYTTRRSGCSYSAHRFQGYKPIIDTSSKVFMAKREPIVSLILDKLIFNDRSLERKFLY